MQRLCLAGLIAMSAFLLTACNDKTGPSSTKEASVIKARIAVAQESRQPILYEAVATISARTASTISGKLMGTVLSIQVKEGDLVKKGDLLVKLDKRQVLTQLDQARAGLREAQRAEASAVSSVESAKAAAQLAESAFQRYQKLLQENSVSRQGFDEINSRHLQAQATVSQAQAMLEVARSRVQQAKAAVRGVKISDNDALVRAPYAGRVVKKLVNTGDLASPGMPLLVLEREGVYCADLELPERYINEVKLDEPVRVVVDAIGADVTGRVGRIIPLADPQSRTFQIKVGMPESLKLSSGMFARVYIPVGGTGMLLVPQSAVISAGQLTGVYIVDENNRARFRLVRTGTVVEDQVQIISGLSAGQKYLPVVVPTINDGDSVRPEK